MTEDEMAGWHHGSMDVSLCFSNPVCILGFLWLIDATYPFLHILQVSTRVGDLPVLEFATGFFS